MTATTDLRVTWPERQLMIREKYKGMGGWCEASLPNLKEFIRLAGGKLPDQFRQLRGTQYIQNIADEATYQVIRGRWPNKVAQQQLDSAALYAWHTCWWEYEGHRIYALDEETAFALLHTHLDDVPTEYLRLPVRSFYVKLPRSLNWTLDINEREFVANEWNRKKETHPEPCQVMEGVMLTGEYEGEKLRNLNGIICGRSELNIEGDHSMGMEFYLEQATLGECWTGWCNSDEVKEHGHKDDETLVKLLLGAILYITSANPTLQAIEPLILSRKALKNTLVGKKRAETRTNSRYTITYVGGPKESVQSHSHQPEPSHLKHRPPTPHMRSGHWRRQAYGTGRAQHKLIWIKPIWVGSWDRIIQYESVKNLTFVIRKTRPAQEVAVKET